MDLDIKMRIFGLVIYLSCTKDITFVPRLLNCEGLDKIHDLNEARFTELKIKLEDWEGNLAVAYYSHFYIQGERDNYRLKISGYSGKGRFAVIVSYFRTYT